MLISFVLLKLCLATRYFSRPSSPVIVSYLREASHIPLSSPFLIITCRRPWPDMPYSDWAGYYRAHAWKRRSRVQKITAKNSRSLDPLQISPARLLLELRIHLILKKASRKILERHATTYQQSITFSAMLIPMSYVLLINIYTHSYQRAHV
jgi:hypothetical protein